MVGPLTATPSARKLCPATVRLRMGAARLKVKVSLASPWTACFKRLSSVDHERCQPGAVMVGDVVGMGLIAVLFVLVVASLISLPGDSGAAARLPKSLASRRRRLPSLRLTLGALGLAAESFQRRMKV